MQQPENSKYQVDTFKYMYSTLNNPNDKNGQNFFSVDESETEAHEGQQIDIRAKLEGELQILFCY